MSVLFFLFKSNFLSIRKNNKTRNNDNKQKDILVPDSVKPLWLIFVFKENKYQINIILISFIRLCTV